MRIGKYALPEAYEEFVRRAIAGQGFLVLPVLPVHTALARSLPFRHRDPFDRLLVAPGAGRAPLARQRRRRAGRLRRPPLLVAGVPRSVWFLEARPAFSKM